MFIDHYKILDIDRQAERDMIKKAYRKLALKFHPDVCKLPNAQIRFIEIQEAYEILGDTAKRHYYNILFDSHYQPKEKSQSEKMFEAKVQADYEQWKYSANKTAVNLAKESFKVAKEKVYQGVGQVIGGTVTFMSYVWGGMFVVGPFVGVATSYSSIDKWDIDKNGNAIAGFVICSILSLLILFFTIRYFIQELKK